MIEEAQIREKKAQENAQNQGSKIGDKKTIEIDVSAMRIRDENARRSVESGLRSQISAQKQFVTPIRPNSV